MAIDNMANYMTGRKKWNRPQAMLWSNDPGTLVDSLFVPQGTLEGEDFIILSDHSRAPIDFNMERIENRSRMINGTMRSYHTADKIIINTGWDRLPSRSFSDATSFNEDTGKPVISSQEEYTVDGGAGGVAILEWYESHPGPFWVYLSYDKYNNFLSNPQTNEENGYLVTDPQFDHLGQYSQVLHMYFASFDYQVEKRGSNNYDMWNISVSLEEV